ncbi:MAG TPA: host attachment protein [Thiolapillus brandeum]|uniref:Host attachment protein n=1 Tax=Thiolapillus brandeum TaxID=1076588 RepID=A0A7C5IYS3_9GAMM|nr:host attachment protein [Thiolapillus brandeum]
MAISWVLAADSSRAKILRADNRVGPLVPIEELEHPESRMKDTELYSDEPGRTFDSGGKGRHVMENEVDAKKEESIRFARALCDKLRQAATEKSFDKLYILAAPAFLGELRECLDDNVKSLVAGEVPKDVVKQTPEEIRDKLPDFL